MRISTAALGAVALAAAVSIRPASAQREGEIFREVLVGLRQPVTLAQPLRPDLLPLFTRVDAHRLKLKPGMFSGAAHIAVQLGDDRRVRCMAFAYAPGFVYERGVESFATELGAPARTGAANDSVQAAHWEDRRTVFSLTRHGDRVESLLCDRATGETTAASAH
jgi:hypothetical protein